MYIKTKQNEQISQKSTFISISTFIAVPLFLFVLLWHNIRQWFSWSTSYVWLPLEMFEWNITDFSIQKKLNRINYNIVGYWTKNRTHTLFFALRCKNSDGIACTSVLLKWRFQFQFCFWNVCICVSVCVCVVVGGCRCHYYVSIILLFASFFPFFSRDDDLF